MLNKLLNKKRNRIAVLLEIHIIPIVSELTKIRTYPTKLPLQLAPHRQVPSRHAPALSHTSTSRPPRLAQRSLRISKNNKSKRVNLIFPSILVAGLILQAVPALATTQPTTQPYVVPITQVLPLIGNQISVNFTLVGPNSSVPITSYRYTTDGWATYSTLPGITSPQVLASTSANGPMTKGSAQQEQ